MKTRFLKPHCFPSILLAALLPALPVCAAETAKTIWKSDSEYVRLIARGGARGARNDHPVKITQKTLSSILTNLKVAPKKNKPRDTVVNIQLDEAVSLFSPAAAQRFGKVLSGALRKAKPNEDIAFQSKDNTSLVGFLKKPVHTTGRMFWKNGRLNIIFGSVHKGIVKRWLYGREVGSVSQPRAAERGVTVANPDYHIALTPGVRHARTRKGKIRADWIVIDPDIAAHSVAVEQKPMAARPAVRGSRPARSLEDRLRRLKKLRRDGLISEKNYREKVREILDEL